MAINLKDHIKKVNGFDRASIAIIASDIDAIVILRNLFNIDISTINLKKKQEISKDINISFEEINNFDAKQFDVRKFDCIIYSIDCISKRIDKKDLRNIIELQSKNTACVCTLNNVEFLDLRELNEMKSVLAGETNKEEILSLFSFKNEAKENEWVKLYEFILNLLDDGLKRSFLRSQTVDVSVKKEISYGIITSYVDVIDDVDMEMMDEKSIEIIINNMIYDIAKVYCCDREIVRTFKESAKEIITSLVIAKKGRLERIIEEENERVRKEVEEKLRKVEEEELRVQAIKKAEEEKLIQEKLRMEEAKKKEKRAKEEKIEEKKKMEYENSHSSDLNIIEKSKSMKADLDERVIIEAIFSVDDVEQVQMKENTNDFEEKVDKILDEIIAKKLKALEIEIKKELKEKLRENNII